MNNLYTRAYLYHTENALGEARHVPTH